MTASFFSMRTYALVVVYGTIWFAVSVPIGIVAGKWLKRRRLETTAFEHEVFTLLRRANPVPYDWERE